MKTATDDIWLGIVTPLGKLRFLWLPASQRDEENQLLILFVFASPGSVIAGPYEDAEAAAWRGDDRTAIQLYRLAAEQRNAEAAFTLAIAYSVGSRVPQDYAEALKWFHRSAELDLAVGMATLSLHYALGTLGPKDDVESQKWGRLATKQFRLQAERGDSILIPLMQSMQATDSAEQLR